MIVLLDKPGSITSASAVRRIGKAAGLRAGHAGTLDPGATGLLVICLDESRKLVALLAGHDKRYRTTIELGTETTTLDRWGEVVSRCPVPALSRADFERALARFTGETFQVVPAFSAVKVDGQPLYRRARRGADVACPERRIKVHDLRLLKVHGERGERFDLEVTCGAGTYIRALARDIAVALGTVGHVVELRRLTVGALEVDQAHGLDEVLGAAGAGRLRELCCDAASALGGHRLFVAGNGAVVELRAGRCLAVDDLQLLAQGLMPAVVLDQAGAPVAIVDIEEDQVHPKRVLLDPDRR